MASAKIQGGKGRSARVDDKASKVVAFIRTQPFENTYNELSKLLDSVKAAAGKGKPISSAPGMTEDSTKAYGDAMKAARETLKKVIDDFKPEEVLYFSGLKFRQLPLPPNPPGFPPPPPQTQDQINRADTLSSVLSAWDKSASHYMSNKIAEGDAARTELLTRLREFDATYQGRGNPPVKPDA